MQKPFNLGLYLLIEGCNVYLFQFDDGHPFSVRKGVGIVLSLALITRAALDPSTSTQLMTAKNVANQIADQTKQNVARITEVVKSQVSSVTQSEEEKASVDELL